jgi:hypothetical protein
MHLNVIYLVHGDMPLEYNPKSRSTDCIQDEDNGKRRRALVLGLKYLDDFGEMCQRSS